MYLAMKDYRLVQRMDSTLQEGRIGLRGRLTTFLRARLRPICDLLAVGAIGAILVAGFRSIPVTAVVVPYPHELAR